MELLRNPTSTHGHRIDNDNNDVDDDDYKTVL